MFRIGGKLYREHYMCFHFHRENIYSAWQLIGMYSAYHKDARSRYIFDYKYFEKHFNKECEKAGDLCGTEDFLLSWRQKHIELNSVISKTVKICNGFMTPNSNLQEMCNQYLGTRDPVKMAKVAIMLRSPGRFYPIVFDNRIYRDEREHLKNANEI